MDADISIIRVINNVRISLKNIVSEIAPAKNKKKATNRNFPFNRTLVFSDFIDVREHKICNIEFKMSKDCNKTIIPSILLIISLKSLTRF
ncbi:MAG: hypothetical protein ACFFDK_09875 [Promethearchaeota archaeon]